MTTLTTIQLGDCRDIIATLPDCSVDSIVTDPPYELRFLGMAWDGSGIAYDRTLWAQCLRVLKPGGHLLAFGGTRTYHRMAAAIEDAGFEIRDSIHWLYGTGFPKSLDVSKAIDKMDAVEEQRARRYRFTEWVRSTGVTAQQIDAATGTNMGGHYTTPLTQPRVMTTEHLDACRHLLGDVPAWVESEAAIRSVKSRNFAKRKVVGVAIGGIVPDPERQKPHTVGGHSQEFDITAPATDAAQQWEGWGTALKPAHEPIVMARKPLIGPVAANVLEHGTGALNIDACRITHGGIVAEPHAAGRWPANLVITHDANCADDCVTGCPVAELNQQSGHNDNGGASRFFTVTEWDPIADAVPFRYEPKPSRAERDAGLAALPLRTGGIYEGNKDNGIPNKNGRRHPFGASPGITGGPSANHHPTVKPIALMRWLVRLVTPPGGTVLEPFAGSGTTMAAAILEDCHVIGCELTADYLPIIEGRIAWARRTRDAISQTLFDQVQP